MTARDLSHTDLAGLELEAKREQDRRHWAARCMPRTAPAPLPEPAKRSYPRVLLLAAWLLLWSAGPFCIALGLWLGSR